MRTARFILATALCATSITGVLVTAPTSAFAEGEDDGGDGSTGTEGETGTEEGDDGGDGGDDGGTEEADDSGTFDNGYQGVGPAELSGEEGGGCPFVSESVVGFGFLGLLGVGIARRRD